MKQESSDNQPVLTIADLYPNLTKEQLQEAEENLEQYIALALRIYERICSDPQAYAQFKKLTDPDAHSSMQEQKPKPS